MTYGDETIVDETTDVVQSKMDSTITINDDGVVQQQRKRKQQSNWGGN